MNNKVLIKLYVPTVGKEYEVWLPLNKKIFKIINLMVKAVNEFTGGYYEPDKIPLLYDKDTGRAYNINLFLKDTSIRNGCELILR